MAESAHRCSAGRVQLRRKKALMFFVHCAWNFMDGFDDGQSRRGESLRPRRKPRKPRRRVSKRRMSRTSRPNGRRLLRTIRPQRQCPMRGEARAAASPSSRKKVPSGKRQGKSEVNAAARQELLCRRQPGAAMQSQRGARESRRAAAPYVWAVSSACRQSEHNGRKFICTHTPDATEMKLDGWASQHVAVQF